MFSSLCGFRAKTTTSWFQNDHILVSVSAPRKGGPMPKAALRPAAPACRGRQGFGFLFPGLSSLKLAPPRRYLERRCRRHGGTIASDVAGSLVPPVRGLGFSTTATAGAAPKIAAESGRECPKM